MKKIETLLEDLKGLLSDGLPDNEIPSDKLSDFGSKCADVVATALGHSHRSRDNSTLRMSSIGQPCNRKLWYSVNRQEEKEDFPPEVRMKFMYGHLIEELLLLLVELSGHRVEGRQDEIEIEGIKGHRDCIIDGTLVDVKSASTYSYKKFEEGKLTSDDPFGYGTQLQSYLHAGQDDPIVVDKDRAAFLVIDKTLGHVCLDVHQKETFPLEKVYQYKKELVSRDEPPSRGFDPIPEGKSGNMKLPINCSYCDFKNLCHPNLRTFLYSNKPVFLTEVRREPNVPELGAKGTGAFSED